MEITNHLHKRIDHPMPTFRGSGQRSSPPCWFGACQIANKKEGAQPKRHNLKNNMASTKKKVSAKASVKFKDLKSKKNPKGGISWSGSTGGDDSPTESVTARAFKKI